MDILIFSKDRASQLLTCIQSLYFHFNEKSKLNIHILYRSSNSDFTEGYELIKNTLHKNNITWHKEYSFNNQTKNIISNFQNELMMFLVDDIVFVNNFSFFDQQFQLIKNTNLLAISLRLHNDIKKCYATNTKTKVPNFIKDCVWDWKITEGDWNYPMSVDGNIYKTSFIKEIIQYLEFNNPNMLEATMDNIKHANIVPTYLCCYTQSPILINVPANRVQNTFHNRYEKSFSAEELNNILLSGKQIDYKILSNSKFDTVHVPIKYNFINIKD